MSARKETPIRLSPSKETLNRLFAVSGNVCAFPGCDHPVFDEDFELVAQVCHIEAAMPGGERFNTESNNEDRRKQENLMVMCLRHHVKTNNVFVYTTEKLREMKRDHEAKFLEKDKQVPIPPMAVDKAYDEIKKISEQILTTVLSTDAKVDRLIEQNEQLTALVTAQSAGPADSPFKSEIDRIMSLRDTFNQQSAIDIFTKFREDNWDKLTSNEKFRTLANLAICYLEINNDGEAADLFIEALEHEPSLVKALGLAALGYTIKEDNAHAEEMTARALALDPLDINAYQAVIHTMALKGESFGTILSAIPEAIRQQHEIAYALAYVAREHGLLNDALTWLHIAYDHTEGQKADLTAAIANVLLETINAESFLLNGIVDQDGKNKARLALQYYTEGWVAIAASTLRPSRSWWLVNRAVAKKFLGDKQGAYDDVLTAWELNSDFWTSRHMAVAALDVRDFEQLHKALARMSETATDEDEKTQTTLFIAEVDVLEGRREQGIAVMEGMLEKGLGEKETIYFRNKLVELYSTAGDTATAEKLIAEMVKEHPDAVRTYITQTQFLNLTGRSNEVRASLEKAKALIDDDTTARDIHELAELFYLSGERRIVAKLLEQIANPGIYSKITRQLLLAYYEAGEHAKLIKTCEGLLAAYGPIDMVTEMLSWAYEGLDDLPAAVKVLTDYLEIYPADQLIQSRLAFVYYRQLDKENLAKLLATIDHIDQTMPMDTQFKLARMFEYIGDLESFKKYSYEVRRNFYEQAQGHDTFVSMFTEFMPNEAPASKPIAAALHTAVTVKLKDAQVTYLIEDRDHYFKTRGEISPQSPMGAVLMGKAVGETFVLEQDALQQEYEIVHIADKFSFAFNESFYLLTTKFVGEAKTKKINIPQKENGELDLEAFFAPLRSGVDDDRYIEAIYCERKLPIGVAASFKRISPIRSWAHYMADPALGVFTTGPNEELLIAEKLIRAGKLLVLDILAITTLSSLDALDDLNKLPNQKIVTRSTLEELYDLIKEQQRSSQSGTFTVGYADGQYVKQVLSPENIQGQVSHLQELADWVNTHCQVVPVTAALKLNAHEKQDLDNKIGKSFVDSILTAQDQKAVLYAEEMPLRGFAFVNYQVNGCATFILLRVLRDLRLIDTERFRDKTLHLMAMNYKFIPVDADILYLAATKSKFTTGFPFNIAVNGLIAPLMLQGFETAEAVKFLYKLYREKLIVILDPGNTNHFQTLLHATLDTLCKLFPPRLLEEDLMRKIDRVFIYLPVQQQEFRNMIRQYFSKAI